MNPILNNLLNTILPMKAKRYKSCIGGVYGKNKSVGRVKSILKARIIFADITKDRQEDYVRQMADVFKLVKIDTNQEYVYPYDSFVFREVTPGFQSLGSMTPDFGDILHMDVRQIKYKLNECTDKRFASIHIKLIDSIEGLANRISQELNINSTKRNQELSAYFPSMLYRVPQSLDEAIQKLLFFDALFWMANHWHIGLGRLDNILYEYYQKDLENGTITIEETKEKIYKLVEILSSHTRSKSPEIYGDTGQYILLGGVDKNGVTVENELTDVFLEIFSEFKKPDPKLILRVNGCTSRHIWEKAVACLIQGTGSPLIMNEEVVIDNMIKFGYDRNDVYNVGTSACWEPLVIGKSSDQNNILPSVVSIKVINKQVLSGNHYSSFVEFLSETKVLIQEQILRAVRDVKLDCSPLFSLFYDDCIQKEKDFSLGGARYSYHGMQIVSFPNTINALLNIKKYIFDEKIITLAELADAIKSNFENREDIYQLLKSNDLCYGSADANVVSLTNDMMTFIGNCIEKVTINGGKVKIGFSSPNYITQSRDVMATPDGRKDLDPFAVHISPLSSKIDIAEVMDFASKLNYENNRINGNVVDFTIPQAYVKNPSKLVDLLIARFKNGLFETQLNVLSYKQLVDAKFHPEKYPNLIVRVWGFSAYFNDLPASYKDNLIERARLYESA